MFCSKCGKEIKDEDKFCTYCGQKVEENTKKEKKPSSNRKKLMIIAIIVMIILIATGIAIWIKSNERENADNINNENNVLEEKNLIEIGKKYKSTSGNMLGEITFLSETEFEKKIGEKNSEYIITEGTYEIEGDKIILTIKYDSNSDYIMGQGSNVLEPYTEEIKINEDGSLEYKKYNITFIFETEKEIEERPIATMQVKGYGTIKIELYPEKAPQTVSNFIQLSNNGFYDGLTFHRVVKGFVIQGGDRLGDGTGLARKTDLLGGFGGYKEYCIKGEFSANGVQNDLKFEEGVIGMARSDYTSYSPSLAEESYNSGSSQFFIMTEKNEYLDGLYTAFGKVIEGLDVVHEIEDVKVMSTQYNSEGSTPTTPIIIESIRVDTKGMYYEIPDMLEPFDRTSLY